MPGDPVLSFRAGKLPARIVVDVEDHAP